MPENTPATANIGVVGLAVMGSNLARNLASREGNTVAVYNRTFARTEELLTGAHPEAGFVASRVDRRLRGVAGEAAHGDHHGPGRHRARMP